MRALQTPMGAKNRRGAEAVPWVQERVLEPPPNAAQKEVKHREGKVDEKDKSEARKISIRLSVGRKREMVAPPFRETCGRHYDAPHCLRRHRGAVQHQKK